MILGYCIHESRSLQNYPKIYVHDKKEKIMIHRPAPKTTNPVTRRMKPYLVLTFLSILALTGCQTKPYEKFWAAMGLTGICMTPDEPERC